jgi:signal transduction histidine kinase
MVTSYTTEHIRALVDAGIALTSELSLDGILQKLVDVARGQVGARYAAISVLNENGEISQFVTSGISDEDRAKIGHIPYGKGLLGVLLREGASLRLPDMAKDPRSIGFPQHHPPMKSLLGVPVVLRGHIIGNLYLTDKEDAEAFHERDEEIVRLLATQAAAAIETSRLREHLESLARLQERERIAMDLHDGVIQTVYAVALHLEDAADRASRSPQEVGPVLERAIENLHHVIKDIRSYIFDLRAQVSEVEDLPGALRELAEALRVNTLMDVRVEVNDRAAQVLEQDQALGVFHIAQEALNNVSKHSRATSVSLGLEARSAQVVLDVEDNGTGFDSGNGAQTGGHGLRNIKDRARAMGAKLTIDSKQGAGTHVIVEVPISRKKGVAG